MRLLNTTNYSLQDFTGSEIPKYAILSHRWEGHELTYQDIQSIKSDPAHNPLISDENGKLTHGWRKIKGACTQAYKDRYEWIWIDSCCIDKTSSAELSEAINSMFVWYKKAEICYAFLSDVKLKNTDHPAGDWSLLEEMFQKCRWFTRGWTLQELLAPSQLRFFSDQWLDLGTRLEMWSVVSKITGIQDWKDFKSATIAQKMSWASRRETTRTEDRAYSLMGLFGVNMPPLYGEGEKAFIRLQLEILRISDDESIFAWEDPDDRSGGLLAHSPDAFRNSGDVKRYDSVHYQKPPYSMTNKGLRVEFPVLEASQVRVGLLDADDTFLAFLQCRPAQSYSMFAILLRRVKGNQFTKVSSGGLIATDWNDSIQRIVEAAYRTVQVRQEEDSDLWFPGLPQYRFAVAIDIVELRGFQVTSRWTSWNVTSGNGWDVRTEDGEEAVLIDRAVVDEGVTAAMEFISRESNGDDSYWGPASEFDQRVRFIIVFNMYAGRARLGILLPGVGETMRSLLKRLVQPGDWMESGVPLQSSTRLTSGARVTVQLSRKSTELWLRSYQANFSFEDSVELPVRDSRLHPAIELPANAIKFIERRNPMSGTTEGNMEDNYYVLAYQLRKELDAHCPLLQDLMELPDNYYVRSYLHRKELYYMHIESE